MIADDDALTIEIKGDLDVQLRRLVEALSKREPFVIQINDGVTSYRIIPYSRLCQFKELHLTPKVEPKPRPVLPLEHKPQDGLLSALEALIRERKLVDDATVLDPHTIERNTRRELYGLKAAK